MLRSAKEAICCGGTQGHERVQIKLRGTCTVHSPACIRWLVDSPVSSETGSLPRWQLCGPGTRRCPCAVNAGVPPSNTVCEILDALWVLLKIRRCCADCRALDRDAAGGEEHPLPALKPGRPGPPAHCGGHRQGEPGQHVHLVDGLVLAMLPPFAKALCSPAVADHLGRNGEQAEGLGARRQAFYAGLICPLLLHCTRLGKG